ncbi:MAG TPA: hypothetical protein VGM98_11325 [Schlesneria sp.]
MARQSMTTLRNQIELVRGLFTDVSDWMTRRRLCRALILVMYVAMNLGLPTGLGPQVKTGSANDSCRCSAESRAAGRCCCAKKAMATGKTGCCATRIVASTKNCCATKKEKDAPAKVKATPEDSLAWSGACPCGPVDAPIMLFCPHPRILAEANSLGFRFPTGERAPTLTDVPCGLRTRPSTPPPQLVV